MHGGTLTQDVLPHYISALRTQEFAYRGMLLGRVSPAVGHASGDRCHFGIALRTGTSCLEGARDEGLDLHEHGLTGSAANRHNARSFFCVIGILRSVSIGRATRKVQGGPRAMRFMMLLKADKNTEAGVLPTAKELELMGKYNEELVKAGVLLDGAGLQPSSKGARSSFRVGSRR